MSKTSLNCLSAVKRGADGKRPLLNSEKSESQNDLKRCLSNAGDSNVDIAIAFDRSGSMASIEKESRDALQNFINSIKDESKNTNGDIRLTLITFDNKATVVYDGLDIEEVPAEVDEKYTQPRGSTRLCDTALEMVTAQEERCYKEWKRVVVILTDGADNASHNTSATLHDKITEAENNDVTCIFLASNQDAIHSGAIYGFSPGHAITFSGGRGTGYALGAVSGGIRNVMHSQSSEPSPHFEFTQLQRECSQGVDCSNVENSVLQDTSTTRDCYSPENSTPLGYCPAGGLLPGPPPPPAPPVLTRNMSEVEK